MEIIKIAIGETTNANLNDQLNRKCFSQ